MATVPVMKQNIESQIILPAHTYVQNRSKLIQSQKSLKSVYYHKIRNVYLRKCLNKEIKVDRLHVFCHN